MNKFIAIESFHPNYIICVLSDGHKMLDVVYSFGDQYDDIYNVYSGIVVNHVESLSAYFINYGGLKNGFLPYSLTKGKLSVGERVIVQVLKSPKGIKGAKLSQFIRIYDYETGHTFAPYGNAKNISEFEANTVTGDINHILWSKIIAQHDSGDSALLYKSKNQIEKFLLRHKKFTDAVIIDAYQPIRIVETCRNLGFDESVVRTYEGAVPLFCHYNIERDISNTLSNSVRLTSGGEIVISQAEAMVAVDVNSASCKDKDLESTTLLVNMEAAEEVARQIRLRNLSGIIVIDFIDMWSPNNRNMIESLFAKHMSGDHAAHNISTINEFGVLMMSRQGSDVSVGYSIYDWCRHCGSGHKNTYHVVREILSGIRMSIDTSPNNKIIDVKCNKNACEALCNDYRRQLVQLEDQYNVEIRIGMHDAHEHAVLPKGVYTATHASIAIPSAPQSHPIKIINSIVKDDVKPTITHEFNDIFANDNFNITSYKISPAKQIRDTMLMQYGLYTCKCGQ